MSDDMLPPEEIDTQEHEINVADATDLPYEDESFHAVVTDPPYNFEGGFLDSEWDDIGSSKQYQKFCEQWASETLRILKPGGHLVSFSGQTQFHRLMSGVEDAGFNLRETVVYLFGNGFPKGDNVEETIKEEKQNNDWDGWKTGLKPGFEPIIIAQKPIEENTIAEQVMETGTGGLNIGGCRISVDETAKENVKSGRYPANVILDLEVSEILDEQEGITKSGEPREETGEGGIFSESVDGIPCGPEYGDEGGPSRFFYTSKASKAERTANGKIENNHVTVKPVDLMQYLVRLVTAEGQKVCDPFLGSGTTLLACEEENRIGYGSDMNEEYCDIATKRLGIRLGTELGSFMDY